MAAPFLVACLAKLRDEFNTLNPRRDTGADGWIGDAAHQAESSDHNPDDTPGVKTPYTDADTIPEVHALDIDSTGPWPAPFNQYVRLIVDRHRAGADDRLQNVIWNRLIASRSWGWTWRTYPGVDPHTSHAHFSARYTTEQETDVSPWGLLEMDMPLTTTDIDLLLDRDTIGNPYSDAGTNPTIRVGTALKAAASADVKLDRVLALLQTLAGRDFTDEDAIARQVLAGLTAPDKTTQQVADALRPVLADRAAEVGRLLAGLS